MLERLREARNQEKGWKDRQQLREKRYVKEEKVVGLPLSKELCILGE